MDANPVAAFVAALNEQQLLPPAQLQEVAKLPQAQGTDPRSLARELLTLGWLTSFQVNLISAGKARELVLGSYVLLDRIGAGGMGEVFKARERATQRLVAIKVVRRQLQVKPEALKRFNQEIQLTAELRHRNVVHAIAAGKFSGAHYFVMEHLEGIDLARMVKDSGPVPVAAACDYMRQAALGLQHAHEKGLVHRDIKPANLMVIDRAGAPVVKILDLGLARLQDQETNLTRLGAVLGTPSYLAPEQIRNSRAADTRSDLYSLGCTFYYLLTGREPFLGETVPEIALKHQFDEATPLETLRADVPPAVRDIIRKLMAKKPEDRFQTPAELAAALTPWCPEGKKPEKKKKSTKRRGSRGKLRVALVAALLVLVGAGLVYLNSLAVGTPPKGTEEIAEKTPETRRHPDSKPVGTSSRGETVPGERETSKPGSKPEPVPTRPEPQQTKPETKPEPKTTKPETKPEPKAKPPEPKVVAKLTVPDAKLVADAVQQVRADHKEDYARKKPAELLALSGRLHKEAHRAEDGVVRFALAREARNLAAAAGDIDEANWLALELAKWFLVDPQDQKVEIIEVAAAAELPAAKMKALAELAQDAAEKEIDGDDYESALRLLAAAEAAAGKAGAPVHALQIRAREAAEMQKEFTLVKKDAATLRAQPDSPDAGYRWGRFLCFFKGKWREGLPLLALGAEGKLPALAKKDQAAPTAAAEQVELGDAWLTHAKSEQGLAHKQALLRAKHWFEKPANLTGTTKFRVENRIEDIKRETTTDPSDKTKPTGGRVFTTTELYNKWMQAGQAAYEQKKFDDAIAHYSEALVWIPRDAKAQAGLRQARFSKFMAAGQALVSKRRYADAAKEFERATKEVPNDPDARAALDNARAMMKK